MYTQLNTKAERELFFEENLKGNFLEKKEERERDY